uniref:Uncharacterized protein n=1 Tax=Acrobeloides nanus TaxID=290746 RepID=A0A914C0J3_9BILA
MLLRDLVIPRAVLFITGEAVEDDDDEDEKDEDEDEDDEDQGCRKLDYFETRTRKNNRVLKKESFIYHVIKYLTFLDPLRDQT